MILLPATAGSSYGISVSAGSGRIYNPSHGRASRRAFTLIELLVVIALLLVLAGLAVAFIPNLGERQREADGAAMLQGWLNIAKQRALRDQAPRGLRLYPSTQAGINNIIIEAQYVDQPDDFTGGTVTTGASTNVIVMQSFTTGGVDPFNGQPSTPSLWAVQPGDYFEILGSGLVHRILSLNAASYPTSYSLTLMSALPNSVTTPTANYRIIRQPRVSGEEKLVLPVNIGIDLNTNNFLPSGYSGSLTGASSPTPGLSINSGPLTPNPDGSIDVLFAPSGNVIGSQVGFDRIIFWVRDYTLPSPLTGAQQGEPTLIVVNSRSGLISAIPVDPSSGLNPTTATPYTFVVNP